MKTFIQKLIVLITAITATAIVVACDNEDHKAAVVADPPQVQAGNLKLKQLNGIQKDLNAQGVSFDTPVRTNKRLENAAPQDLAAIRANLVLYLKTGTELLPLIDSPQVIVEDGTPKSELRHSITSRLDIAQSLLDRIEHPDKHVPLAHFEAEYIQDYQGLIELTTPTPNPRRARQQARELRQAILELAPHEVVRLRGRTKAMLNLAFANKRPPEVTLAYQTILQAIIRALPPGSLADRTR